VAETRRIAHGRIRLALHVLAEGPGDALLLLHALRSSSAGWNGAWQGWPGPVFALDFSGHGASDHPRGAAYSPELLLTEADAALAHVGGARLAGAGLGAYVALLLAGARSDAVETALLLPGAGLEGGGPHPDPSRSDDEKAVLERLERAERGAGSDPGLRHLERDARPPDYAAAFAHSARRLLLAEDGAPRPPWWEAVREVPGAERVPAEPVAALARLAR
jgi:pimeloyl-ACP methyl ester carboxylesterase